MEFRISCKKKFWIIIGVPLFLFTQTKSSGGEKTADMRGGTRETGSDPPQESGEGSTYRGEEEERKIAHRLRVRQLHTANAGTRRHRRLHLLGHPQGHFHHQCHDVLRGATPHQEILREGAWWQQKTGHFRRRTRSETRRRSVNLYFFIYRVGSHKFTKVHQRATENGRWWACNCTHRTWKFD